MKDYILDNPFPVNTYYGARYFCDRQNETSRIISNIENGISTTLLSVRRIGKTGLIKHTLGQLPEGWKGIYVDIFETENLHQFLDLLATSIIKNVPEKSSFGKKVWDLVKIFRPVVSYDMLTGAPQATFDLKQQEVKSGIDAVLQLLEEQNFKVVIAIDEFQQIHQYPEQNTEAWLRSRMQQLKNVFFIFSGSQQHIMNEMFTSPSRPFFRSTQIMKLEKIEHEVYANFIIDMFSLYKKEIDKTIVDDILNWTNVHTFYVQQLCNKVFAVTHKRATAEMWKQQAYLLLKEQESVFFAYRNMLTIPQWQLLKAVAGEGIVKQPTSAAFQAKYKLGTSATILRSLKTLQDYELVHQDYDQDGNLFYSVFDVFLQQWAKGRQ